jgi:membrane protease YdiL (CAAX protease family)
MDIQHYKHPYLFYFFATLIPWGLWLIVAIISHSALYGYDTLSASLSIAGLLAPLLLAFTFIFPNTILRKDFLGRIVSLKKVNLTYLYISFLLMPFSIILAQLVSLFFGYSAEQFQLSGSYSFSSGIFPVWFILIFAPIVEELAWHSYGIDCLRNRFNLFNTSIIFALFWGIWHFPLSFIKDYYHSNIVEVGLLYSINFFVSLFPFVIIMNWLYYKTNRNILTTIIFHISAGYFNEIFASHPMSKVIQTGLLIMLSFYIMISDKQFFFNK